MTSAPPSLITVLLLMPAWMSGTAAGQTQHSDLDEIVIVESRIDEQSYRVGTQISVDGDDMAAIVPADIEELLERLPGVSVNRPGGPGGISEVFLRGAESNFTAVFIDGIRLNDPTNTRGGSFDFSSLAASEVQRIDIAMGAMSAIYGSDAMAGVIRIDSAWPEPGEVVFHGEAGTASDWRAGIAGSKDLTASTKLGLRFASRDAGDEIEGSSYSLTSIAAQLSGRFSGEQPWRIVARHADRERSSFPEVSGGPEYAVIRDLEHAQGSQTSFSAQTEFAPNDEWGSEILVAWNAIEEDSATPAVAPGELDPQPAFTTDSQYSRGQISWINRLDVDENLDLAFGLDAINESGRDDGNVDLGFGPIANDYRLDRTVASAFGEMGNKWNEMLSSNAALRIDQVDGQFRFSGKVGAVLALDSMNTRFWARFANGFKLPSFFALGNPLFGNPALDLEEIRNIELGVGKSFGDAQAGLSLFSSRYTNLVDFDFETFTNVNRGRIDIDGVEVTVDYAATSDLRLGADFTWSDISSSGEPLRRRPEAIGGATVRWTVADSIIVDAAVRYVGSRLVTSIPTGDVHQESYVLVDATLSWQISESVILWVAVDNATDAEYQDSPGFPSPHARARVGFRVTL